MIPKIKVHLYLSANSFDLAEVTRRLGVNPTRARENTEWPQVSIDMGIAHASWTYTTIEKQCLSIENPFKELIEVFFPKIAVIKELIQEFRLETTLVVVINGESVTLPEMHLSEEIIAFAASINSSIGFDMYLD
ncbi:MAG: DUF4279 domain-containing protein [Oscillospiraceae bacterium]|nr:DUF4279 domain-containing protein [Oscillospiraceae bacterium]